MKKAHLLLFVLFISFSCQDDVDPVHPIFDWNWVFSGYQSSWSADPTFNPISDSLYIYQFQENGSFSKTIGSNKLTGTFQIEEDQSNQREFLSLDFDDASIELHQNSDGFPLIHSCTGVSETLVFEEEGTLFGSWSACDGPTLFFTRE
ncbi:hypothetical protein [Algoriphagus formosus]|uniref:Lipocalin-like domain-containing protein n=1 Tax=Algoriphagus formosus TaxID=2007308 RepID=A0A4R5UXL4_9BACT|nr:hypothetical protein [Algoriphagus aquimaris]TDK44088.1 hypothetical protein E1898_10425 [Algoriphagus aquimaris]